MNQAKKPQLDHPIQEHIAGRWSPYVFADKAVAGSDLRSLFEAARWAASAFNEQPWRYIVATRDNSEEYAKMLSCLVEANQVWAKNAPVLTLALTRINYTRNRKPNGTALHDLGLATGNLIIEASARGIMGHQMAGILPDRVRELYQVPADFAVVAALALGYPGQAEGEIAQRDAAPRPRRQQSEFVFAGAFGQEFTG